MVHIPGAVQLPGPASKHNATSARLYGFKPGGVPADGMARQPRAPIFIHASWRTSHTWFWLKFREASSTLCFCEPFHEHLAKVTRSEALVFDAASWDSGHPASNPYFLEFLPLIRRSGGVRLFVPEISHQWFLPAGGLDGDLRPEEIRYLALLVRHAERRGSIPVFGFSRSVGRLVALKKRFSGFHIFQYRNLWTQWMSILRQKRRGNPYFICVILDILLQAQDRFLSTIVARHLSRGVKCGALERDDWQDSNRYSQKHLAAALAAELPEQDLFILYMALHTYVYAVAQLNADLVVDITKVARDRDYRERVSHQLNSATGIPVTLSDVRDAQQYHPFDGTTIDWQEIKDNFGFAVQTLDNRSDRQELLEIGANLINETLAEMRLSEKYLGAARHEIRELARERDIVAAEKCSLIRERDLLTAERDAAIAERDCIAEQRDATIAATGRLVRERDAANIERDTLVRENARLADRLAAAATTCAEQRSELETQRIELGRLAADRARIAAESARWFDAAIVAAADGALDPHRSGWGRRFRRLTIRLRAAAVRSRLVGEAVKRSPKARADRAWDAGQWERAARFYLDMLNQDPFAVAIWVQLGNALKEAGKVAEAELAYCRAVALGADGLDTLLSLCGLLKLQQKTAEAANSAR